MGNMQDLENAIKHTQAAVENTPPHHPESAIRLNNLGKRYLSFAQYPQAVRSFLSAWECLHSPLLERLRGASELHLSCLFIILQLRTYQQPPTFSQKLFK